MQISICIMSKCKQVVHNISQSDADKLGRNMIMSDGAYDPSVLGSWSFLQVCSSKNVYKMLLYDVPLICLHHGKNE